MKYLARLIENGRIVDTIEFQADPKEAWKKANDGVSPLEGRWVDVVEAKPKPDKKQNGSGLHDQPL